MFTFDSEYCMDKFRELLAIDSTTGQFREIQDYLMGEIESLGFSCYETHKGGVIAELGGEGDALCVTAHVDDIGLMVRRVNTDGTLNVCMVGGLHPLYAIGENVRVYTMDDQVYTGTVCRTPASVHVTEEELRGTMSDYRKNVCVVLDEDVHTAQDTRDLGIETGDLISLEPRCVTSGGYIKSRFIDDKAQAAILLTAMKYLRDQSISLPRRVVAYFAMYEEIGHGTTWLPDGIRDILALDIAPTGPDQTSDERKVSIFCKDTRFPYHREMTQEIRETAERLGIDYVMDVFTPHYGTDADASVLAGYDIRHAAIGPGTANSHGYERTHLDGLRNTYELLLGILTGA